MRLVAVNADGSAHDARALILVRAQTGLQAFS